MSCAPASATRGRVYTIPVTSTTYIQKAALIRPAAVTHGFDADQRFVPVDFVKASSPSRLLLRMPSTADSTPPGYYLLFLTGSADGPDVPSIAKWVKVVSTSAIDGCDATRPEPIEDLLACPDGAGNIVITWTAPADDSAQAASGKVTAYDLRWSHSAITDGNWGSASQLSTSAPGNPGASETKTMTGAGSANWYFRIKSLDDNDHYAALSNQAFAGPLTSCDDFLVGGGGGGGGSHARHADGLSAQQQQSSEGFAENSVMDGAATDTPARDLYRLAATPAIEGEAYALRLRGTGSRSLALDAARLLVVDHSAEVRAFGVGGEIVLGERMVATRVTGAIDLTEVLDGSSEYAATAGETLTVKLAEPPNGSAPGDPVLVIEANRGIGASGGAAIEIETRGEGGGWEAVASATPRRNWDELTTTLPSGADSVRLAVIGDCTLRFVGSLARSSESAEVHTPSLLSAVSSHNGDVQEALAIADSVSLTIADADTVSLAYQVPEQAEATVREYFLAVDATPLANHGLSSGRARVELAALPAAFALRQNQPNPFRGRTTIRFELPVGAMVRLEVFDIQGRRLTTLANHYYPPGHHAVAWDHRTQSGASVGPGIYFYRIEAGTFRDRKKMSLVP